MKKLTNIILIIAMLAALIVPISAGAEEYENPSYETGLLSAISFLTDDGFSEDEAMTRGEFCNMVCKLFKYESYATNEVAFKDIDSTHPYYNAISALYAIGAINGVTKYSVAPNKAITLAEAGTILVSALGYGQYMDNNQTAYTQKASELGLFDGTNCSVKTELTEEKAITMCYNALFAPILYYGAYRQEVGYPSDKNRLMMNVIYDMYEIKGIITENDVTSLYGISSLRENEIKIDTDVYSCYDTDISDLLGYPVKAYVISGDDEDRVIYAYANESKFNVTEINADDIENAVKTQIDYYDGGRVKTAKLSKAADVVYNGIGLESYDNSILNPVCGTLKLVDNDGDGTYDIVFVTKYDFYMIQNASKSDKEIYIYDADGNTLTIDLVKVDCKVNVWVNGDNKDFSVLTKDTAVMAVDSGTRDDIRLIDFYVLTDKLSGKLSSANDEYIILDGKRYESSSVLDTASASKYISKEVYCFLDLFGNAIYIQNAEGSSNYGFLWSAKMAGDDETVKVKILGTDNEWKTYNLKEKLKCNSENIKAENMLTKLTGKQVVRYTVDENGLISRLDLAEYKLDGGGKVDMLYDKTLRDDGKFRMSREKQERRYAHNTTGLFDGQGYNRWIDCFFAGGLPVLVRPDSNDFSEQDVLFYTNSYFVTDMDYVTEVYDVTDDNYASFVVVYGSATATIKDGSVLYMADRIKTELDEDELPVKRLYAWYNGVLTPFDAAEDTSLEYGGSDVKRGDLFRIATNFSGEIEYVEQTLAFRVDSDPEAWFTDKSSAGPNNSAAYGRHQIAVGRVADVNGDLLRIKVKDGKYIDAKLRDAAYFYVYDKSNKDVITKGTRADIKVGDVIVARMYFGRLDQVFIYKNL